MSTMKHSSSQLIRQHHPHAKVDIHCVSNQYISTITINIIILLSINIFPLTYSLLSVESFMATIPCVLPLCIAFIRVSIQTSCSCKTQLKLIQWSYILLNKYTIAFPVAFLSCSVSSGISSNFHPSQKANDSDDRWGKIHTTAWILLNPKMKTAKMAEITCIIFWKTCPTGQHVYHNFYNMNDTFGIHLQWNQLENNPNPSWKHRCRRRKKRK